MFSNRPPHMAEQKQDDQLEPTYSSSLRIRDVTLRTCQKRCTIGKSGERGSGMSMLLTCHDDDEWYHLNYQPDRVNLTDKKKESNRKRFRLFHMYKIYLSSESVPSSQPKIEIERKKLVAAEKRATVNRGRRKRRQMTFVIFLLASCFCNCVIISCDRSLGLCVSLPSLRISP